MCIVLIFGTWIIERGIFMCIVLVFGTWIIERGIIMCIVLVLFCFHMQIFIDCRTAGAEL